MININQYFGEKIHHPECTAEMIDNAHILLLAVNALIQEAIKSGKFQEEIDPDTGSTISGSKGGSGDGGFRLSNSSTGAAKSAHKKACGVDKYDPHNQLDSWLDGYEREHGYNSKLADYGLFREAPSDTPGWCHLQTIPPRSGRRTFNP